MFFMKKIVMQKYIFYRRKKVCNTLYVIIIRVKTLCRDVYRDITQVKHPLPLYPSDVFKIQYYSTDKDMNPTTRP